MLAGWLNRHQQEVIDYLIAENRVLKEQLNRLIFFGADSLRRALDAYESHYNRERNHQGIDNRLIEPSGRAESTSSTIECLQRLGGMLRFYHHAS